MEKDKTKYFLWEKAFDALVDSAPVTDLQKLHLLYQHLDGRAKKVVEQLQYMIEDPATAYNEARKILKERFGTYRISRNGFREQANELVKDWKQRRSRNARIWRLLTTSQDS